MDTVIRSAVLGAERRRLARPAPQAAASAVPAAAPAASAAAQRADIARLEHDHAEQIAAVRREVEAERGQLRAAMAAEQADALRAAAEAGFAEGVGKGEAAGRERLDAAADRLDALAAELQACRAGMIEAAQDTLVEIAFSAICRIAGAGALSRAAVTHAVNEAAADLGADKALRVLVHPDDLAGLDEAAGRRAKVAFVATPAVAAGGCMIEGPNGTLDARLEIQLAQLAAALGQARAGEPG